MNHNVKVRLRQDFDRVLRKSRHVLWTNIGAVSSLITLSSTVSFAAAICLLAGAPLHALHRTAGPIPASASAPSGEPPYDTTEIFSRLAARHEWQTARISRLSDLREYHLRNSRGRVLAEETVRVDYKAPATEAFTVESGRGSSFIRTHIFGRLLRYEARRVREGRDRDRLITAQNYSFQIVRSDRINGADCIMVHAKPRRRASDLFEGDIWIDQEDFAIVKISGHLVRSPSFWVKRVDFVREYAKIGDFWLLSRETADSQVRFFGRESMTAGYRDYVVNGASAHP